MTKKPLQHFIQHASMLVSCTGSAHAPHATSTALQACPQSCWGPVPSWGTCNSSQTSFRAQATDKHQQQLRLEEHAQQASRSIFTAALFYPLQHCTPAVRIDGPASCLQSHRVHLQKGVNTQQAQNHVRNAHRSSSMRASCNSCQATTARTAAVPNHPGALQSG